MARNMNRALSLNVSYHAGHRQLWRDAYQHVDVVGHDMAFLNFALFLFRQSMEQLAQLTTNHSEERFPSIFRDEYDMVFALPLRVAQTLVIFHGINMGL